MFKRLFFVIAIFGLGVGATLYISNTPWALGQLSERPGNSLDNPIDTPKDLSGLSIKNPRVRVVHTADPWLEGGSMYLQQVDPWLGDECVRSIVQPNFRYRD